MRPLAQHAASTAHAHEPRTPKAERMGPGVATAKTEQVCTSERCDHEHRKCPACQFFVCVVSGFAGPLCVVCRMRSRPSTAEWTRRESGYATWRDEIEATPGTWGSVARTFDARGAR